MKKIHHVFISSTYLDLKEEREEAMNAIIRTGCHPIGMEFFPANPATPWKVIERAISDCDFYIVIIANRYGTIEEGTEISYTEREFNYALEHGRKFLAFLISDFDEGKADNYEKIRQFREKIQKGCTPDYFENKYDLGKKIAISLSNLANEQKAKDDKDAFDRLYDLIDVLQAQINSLAMDNRDEHSSLQEQINSLAEAVLRNGLSFAKVSEKVRELKKKNNLQ